jgi:hypothetical protein
VERLGAVSAGSLSIRLGRQLPARGAGVGGFQPHPLTTQRAWLLSLGLGQITKELDLAGFEAALEAWQEQAWSSRGD